MGLSKTIWSKPAEYLHHHMPQDPVLFFAPGVLQDTARRFIDGLPGQVSYVVAANPTEVVIENLAAAGLRSYDVACPAEMRMIRRLAPEASLHHSTPSRGRADIALALELGVRSFAVTSEEDLQLLLDETASMQGVEIVARANVSAPHMLATLLARVSDAGCIPAVGLDFADQIPDASELQAAFETAKAAFIRAEVAQVRLHIRGAFQFSDRAQLKAVFAMIADQLRASFGDTLPALVCAVGRGIVADSVSAALQVTAIEGTDGLLHDAPNGKLVALVQNAASPLRLDVVQTADMSRHPAHGLIIAGGARNAPLPHSPLPADLGLGDYVIIHGLGGQSAQDHGDRAARLQTVLMLR